MKVDCFDLARYLISKGISNEKVIIAVKVHTRRKNFWTDEIINRIRLKIKDSYKNRFSQRTVKKKIKICKYPGCGKEYMGHPVTKFCDFHQIVKNRQIKVEKKTANSENRIINHNFDEVITQTVQCELLGCKNKFDIEIVPKQYVYPKYCISHRNKFKRDLFLKEKS
jgi:hypothetical protein